MIADWPSKIIKASTSAKKKDKKGDSSFFTNLWVQEVIQLNRFTFLDFFPLLLSRIVIILDLLFIRPRNVE